MPFENAKKASLELSLLDDKKRNEVLLELADTIESESSSILQANAMDLSLMDKSNPIYDRLLLNEDRLRGIASDMRHVATLPSPLGRILEDRYLPNGLHLKKISVPYGVIGVIYEARPNVTFDVFALCFKSGNACILKGGKDADNTNRTSAGIIRKVLEKCSICPDVLTLLPSTHEAAASLLNAKGLVDLVIPRGGRRLIDFVRDNAKVPCIETGAGVVNTYFDKDGDLEIGKAIVLNAKTRRVSVCNALDCLIIHKDRLADLQELCTPLSSFNVRIYADNDAYSVLDGKYPFLEHSTQESYGTEYMDWKMSVKTVSDISDALQHIRKYGSGHSESIITSSNEAAGMFQACVDAACVYVNAPTSFTDGAQFGLGAEIGISTQKLGARGPMGLNEITTYKWLIEGNGQTRK